MAKQLNVSLAFTADTSQAAAQVKSLQQQLTNLVNQPIGIGQKMTAEIQEATNAAAELKVHLESATNVKTGTLDFGKLNQSLKASGTTLSQYAAKLQSLGPQGKQAFMQLANSVAQAEVPLRRSSTLLQQMGTTLMNTARWQLSSSILHGFMGAVSKAYNYSKDLNESLNNIRIVTGYNTDQMAKFAAEANKAAKALSTTTTEYTNASLIYYQQGLNDAEVKARTDVTIKMANASRQSAEIVSDQMTSIWNNFYDGSKSLEYYADVVTALGAATASSSEEIATGLEKFAAVAETVGLSYEYATSALATITATTRQSADIVGTALKTLFARLSDLKLGETLEDGTTLGQYSENLAKIGVNIKDTSGDLKDMDTILNETAAKWDNLSKAQQVALAKGVAGIRQYTQFIALMDNWDFMEQNLATVNSSSGTLTKQAKTYEESWEAASKRVQASLEAIYESIMDDEFFIDLTNGFAKLIDGVGGFVKSIGGLQGVLSGLGFILTKVFATQMAEGFRNLAYNIQMSTDAGVRAVQQAKMAQMEEMSSMMINSETSGVYDNTMKQVYSEELKMQTELVANAEKLSAEDQKQLQILLQAKQVQSQQTLELAKQVENAQELASSLEIELLGRGLNNFKHDDAAFKSLTESIGQLRTQAEAQGQVDYQLKTIGSSAQISSEQVQSLVVALGHTGRATPEIQQIANSLIGMKGSSLEASQAITQIKIALEAAMEEQIKAAAGKLGIKENTAAYRELETMVREYANTTKLATSSHAQLKVQLDNGAVSVRNFSNQVKHAKGVADDWAVSLSSAMSGLMSAGMLISSIKGLMDTISNPDTSGWEKFSSILMSVSMISISLMGTFKGIKAIIALTKSLFAQETVAKVANAIATNSQAAAERRLNEEKAIGSGTTRRSIKQTWADTKSKMRAKGQSIKTSWNDGAWRGATNKQRATWYKQSMQNQGYTFKGGQFFDAQGNIVDSKIANKNINTGAKGLAGKASLAQVGKAALGAAIVVAAVVAAAAAIKAASDFYNRFEIAAKKARETADALNESYEQVKSTESEFRDNIKKYNEGVEGLEKLTRGTDEYKEAVRQANESALALIKTHKNLAYEINADGLIVIDEGSLLAAQHDSVRKEARALAASLAAEQEYDNARLEADKVNFQRTTMKSGGISWDSDDTAIAAGAGGASLALGAGAVGYTAVSAGSLATALGGLGAANGWNPVGWVMLGAAAIIAGVGAIMTATNNDAEAREAETLDALQEYSKAKGGRSLSEDEIREIADLKDSTGKLGDSLVQDIDATNSMIAAMRANTEAIERNNDLIASQVLATNSFISGSEYADEIYDIGGDVWGIEYEKALAEVKNSGWGQTGIAQINGANAEAERVWKEYNELMGTNLELVDTTGTDKNRKFVYLENGERKEITLEVMWSQKATVMAERRMTEYSMELTSLLAEWSKKTSAEDQALRAFLGGKNFDDATYGEFVALMKDIGGQDIESYLKAKFGDLEDLATKMGFESAEALILAFKGAIEGAEISWGDVTVDGTIKNNTKLSSAQQIENTAFAMNGTLAGGGDIFQQGLNQLTANMTPEQTEEFLEKVAALDWSQYNTVREIPGILKEMGVAMNMSEEDFNAYAKTVNTASGAVFDYGQALEDINKIDKIAQDITVGDVITQEEYDLLVKYNEELANYFRILGDGSAIFVGDPLDFKQDVKRTLQNEYKMDIDGARDNYKHGIDRMNVEKDIEATGYTREQLVGTGGYEKTVVDQKGRAANGWEIAGGAANVVMGLIGLIPTGGATEMNVVAGWDMFINGFGTSDVTHKEWERYDDLISAQLDFLKQTGEFTAQQIADLGDGSTQESAEKIAAAVEGYFTKYTAITQEELDKLREQAFSAQIDYAMTAEDADERRAMYERGEIDSDAYQAAQAEAITQEAWENVDADTAEAYSEHLQDTFGLFEEEAEEVARAVIKMNHGIQTLSENWATWGDILNNSSSDSQEYAEAMGSVKKALSDILDVSEDFISNNFIASHLYTIQQAAEGSEEAIDKLGLLLAEDIFKEAIKVNLEGDVQAIATANSLMSELSRILSTELPGFKVGEIVDKQQLIDQMNAVVTAAKMTTEQANAWYRSMGFTPKFKTETLTADTMVPLTTTVHSRDYSKDVYDDEGRLIGWTESEYSFTTQGKAGEYGFPVVSMGVETGDGKEYQIPSNQVESLTYTGGGSMSNFSSTNKGGDKKGGSGSKKDKKTSRDKERYYEINQALDTMAQKLDRLALAKERAFGKAKSDLIKQELGLIDDEISKTEELLEAISQKAIEDKTNLAAFGFTFDDENNINNYDAIMDAEIARYNAAIETGDESEIAAAEERWELLQDYLSQYEETMDKWDETVTTQMEQKNKKYEKLFEDITYNIEVDLKLEDDQIKFLDHQLTMLEDKSFSAAEAIGLLGDKTQSTLDKAAIYAQGITDILSLHGLDKKTLDGVMNGSISITDIKDEYGFSDEDVDQIRSYVDGLMQANVDLMQLRNTVQEKVIETFQEWNAEMDRGISKLDHLSGVIDAYQNIVDLVGKAALGVDSELMIKMSKAKTANAQDVFKANKAKYDAVVEARNKAEMEYQAAIERDDEASIKKWEDTLKQLDDEVQSAHSSMLESWQSTLEAAQAQFELTVEETISTFERALSGTFGSFDALQEAFNQQNEVMDRYVQDYTKIYELTKLTRDIMNSIDETDNVKAKRALRDLQEEITALQESDKKMSQYDLDYLRKKYELRVAEIALEEAQNAKSQVRMRKDSEGNYSYVFTADEQAIAEAQQNYEDKLYEMQELNTNYIREMQNNILQSEIELTNALRALDRSKYASDEEYYAEVNRLQGYYAGQHTYYLDELNKGLNNNQLTYAQDWYQYSQYTGYKISADQDYIDSFNETVYSQLTGYNTIAEAQEAYLGGTQIMVNGLITAYKEWYANVETTMNNAGTSMKDFADDAEDAVDKVTTESQEAANEVADAADKFVDEFGKVCDEVTAWQEVYSDAIDLALESNTSMMTSCTDLINMLSGVDGGLDTTSQKFAATAAAVEAAAARIAAAAAAAAASASKVGQVTPIGTETETESTKTQGRTFKVTSLTGLMGYNAMGMSLLKKATPEESLKYFSDVAWQMQYGKRLMVGTTFPEQIMYKPISHNGQNWYYYNGYYYPASGLETFKTGGYTGDWGVDGRLAMLHQKELVLNAHDTENMLNAVNIIRDISRVIDLNAASSANAFNLISSTYATNGGQTIEQEVTIHAEFPNATNHTEIEEAFNTLINQAAQFANRKN